MDSNHKTSIIIFTTIDEDWGGSEELWARSIPFLQSMGYEITVLKNKINREHPKFKNLHDNNVKLIDLTVPPQKPERFIKIVFDKIKYKIIHLLRLPRPVQKTQEYLFLTKVKEINPSLVILAQGVNFDGLEYAHQFYLNDIPYVTIAQKAVDFFWPNKYSRPYMKIGLLNAAKCFFVSQHNLRITEEQFACRITNSVLVHNPIKLRNNIIPYPSTDNGFHLACIGRLFILDKGQDILIKILSDEKWKARNIYISVIGEGVDQNALIEMCALLGITNIKFVGFINTISEIWKTHHALILPSRSEGMPLVMLEAMSAGRTVIVSDAGGNSEVITDGENGFIGNCNQEQFDATMERAWKKRNQWQEIGLRAAAYITSHFPESAENDFANAIKNVIDSNLKKIKENNSLAK